MLTQLERPGIGAQQIAELAEHLRLPTGFGDDALVKPMLMRCIEFAIGQIEARTGRALAQRRFRRAARAWDETGRFAIGVLPVTTIDAFALIEADGRREAVDPAQLRIETTVFETFLVAREGRALPPVPSGGSAEIEFCAGYGPDWLDVPVDLRQATLLAAAHAFERPEGDAPEPVGVLRLIEPYRKVRL